jgi:hypothetical protein
MKEITYDFIEKYGLNKAFIKEKNHNPQLIM